MILQNKYTEAAAHLHTTPDMRARLLQAVEAMPEAPHAAPAVRAHRRIRRAAALAACLVIAVAVFGLARRLPPSDVQPALTPDSVQETLAFTLYAPSALPDDYALTDFTATGNTVTLAYTCGDAAITYVMGESVAYPDSIGAPEADAPQIIPGGAEKIDFVVVGDWFVTLYGSGDACLYADGYDLGKTFQLAFSTPLTKADALAVIESIQPCR